MVRLRDRAPGAGRPGKLKGDPAVSDAAVAIQLGLDPLAFLALAPPDYLLVQAALERAYEEDERRQRAHADYLSARTAGLTVQALTKWIAKNF